MGSVSPDLRKLRVSASPQSEPRVPGRRPTWLCALGPPWPQRHARKSPRRRIHATPRKCLEHQLFLQDGNYSWPPTLSPHRSQTKRTKMRFSTLAGSEAIFVDCRNLREKQGRNTAKPLSIGWNFTGLEETDPAFSGTRE